MDIWAEETKAINGGKIAAEIYSNTEGNIKPGDTIEYTINVKNIGEITESLTIEDVLPEELSIKEVYCIKNGQENKINFNANVAKLQYINLKQNEEITIKIVATVNEVSKDTQIENYATISGLYIEEMNTEKIINTIVVDKPEEPEEPEDPENPEYPEEPENPEDPENPEEPEGKRYNAFCAFACAGR